MEARAMVLVAEMAVAVVAIGVISARSPAPGTLSLRRASEMSQAE